MFRCRPVAMFQNGRWATPGIRTVDFDWDVVGLPEGPAGPGNWLFWGAYVVNADTADPAAAWELGRGADREPMCRRRSPNSARTSRAV